MPEMPEIQAHAERLTADFGGRVLKKFTPFNFTALKTAVPAPDTAYGEALRGVGRRGKYLLLDFGPTTFVIHLMQGGRLLVDSKLSAKPRGGQARFTFEPIERDDGSIDTDALLLTEQGSERRAGVWCVTTETMYTTLPLDKLGPEAATITAPELAALFEANSMRVHGFLRDQRMVSGVGRRLANEVCHTAKISPFANTRKLGAAGAEKVVEALQQCIAEGLDVRTDPRRHELVEGPTERGACPDRRGLPRVRRHHPGRVVLRVHRQLLPHLPDRRQDPRRQHDEQIPEVVAGP